MAFKNISKQVARTKHQVMASFGKADQTKDVNFKAEKDKFEERHKLMNHLEKSLEKYLKTLKDLSTVHAELTENIHLVYEGHCALYGASVINQKVTANIDTARVHTEELIREHALLPLSEHLAQYQTLQKRMQERSRRLTDMDRYNTELHDMEKKGDNPKLPLVREKAENMTRAYNDLNDELLKDMSKLVDDRFIFFDPLFANIVDAQTSYYKQVAGMFGELENQLRTVNRQAYRGHLRVITSDEESFIKKAPGSVPYVPPSGGAISGGPYAASSSGVSGGPYATPTTGSGVSGGPYAAPTQKAPPSQFQQPPQPQFQQPPQQQFQPPPQQQFQQAPGYSQPIPNSTPNYAAPSYSAAPTREATAPTYPAGVGIKAAPPPQHVVAPPAQRVIRARALYPFAAQEQGELPFQFNDILTILNQQGDWWEAELKGRKGLIPANYVELLP